VVPHVPIRPFQIPQIRNRNKKNHAFITNHEEIVGAVRKSVFQRFEFPPSSSKESTIFRFQFFIFAFVCLFVCLFCFAFPLDSFNGLGDKDVLLEKVLKELNDGHHLDFLSEKDLNDDLLRADLERIYLIAVSRFQNQLALYLNAETHRISNNNNEYQSLLGMNFLQC
jgi:hypothetical protein